MRDLKGEQQFDEKQWFKVKHQLRVKRTKEKEMVVLPGRMSEEAQFRISPKH